MVSSSGLGRSRGYAEKHEFESRYHAKNTKNLITIMKTFSELQKDDKVYIIDSFGNLEITSITNIVFSTNEEKVKVNLYDKGVFYFPYHSTQYSMYDSIIFSDKEEALIHLKGIKDWAENIIGRTTESIITLTK